MTATTMTPAAMVHEGHAALHDAMDRPRLSRRALNPEIIALGDALSTYEELDGDALHWESVWPHLRDEADPDEAALLMAAEDVESATGDLIAAMAAAWGRKITEPKTGAEISISRQVQQEQLAAYRHAADGGRV